MEEERIILNSHTIIRTISQHIWPKKYPRFL